MGEVPGDGEKSPAPGYVTFGKAFSLSEVGKGIAVSGSTKMGWENSAWAGQPPPGGLSQGGE